MPMFAPLAHRISKRSLLLLAGDMLAVGAASLSAILLRMGPSWVSVNLRPLTLSMLVCVFVFYLMDLYDPFRDFLDFAPVVRLLTGVALGLGLILCFFYAFPSWRYGRGVFALAGILIASYVLLWRLLYVRLVPLPKTLYRVLIVGAGAAGRMISQTLERHSEYRVAGFVDDDPARRSEVLGDSGALPSLIETHRVNMLILAIMGPKKPELYQRLLECKLQGIGVRDMTTVYHELTGALPIRQLNDAWFIHTPISAWQPNAAVERLKRIMDVLLAGMGLLLSLPLSLLAALAVKLDSSGPLFYCQVRLGRGEKPFRLFKFRTMRTDAEAQGAIWAAPRDERVTRAGRWLRRFRIDEIPQLWNTLRGDMSLVGPRPERPEFIAELKSQIPYYSLRHSIKPGVTGWAQVNYPYGSSIEDALKKLAYDLFYIQHLSIIFDVYIMLRTLRVVIWGRGGR